MSIAMKEEQRLAEMIPLPERGSGDGLPVIFRQHLDDVQQVVHWVHDYLSKPHPELGRKGPVCPFVPTALEMKSLYMSIYEGDLEQDDIRQIALNERDRFLEVEPKTGNNAQFKSILMLFPNVPQQRAMSLVEAVQEDLRFEFVPLGLMIGEFHSGPPNKPGLWNDKFLPLNCPIPMLVIRHMVPTDILFLKDEKALMSGYLKVYGDMVPSKFKQMVHEAADRFGFELPEKIQGPSSAPSVLYHLQKNNVSFKAHRHSRCATEIREPRDFAKELGYQNEPDRICKTLFLQDPLRNKNVVAVLPAMRDADLTMLADAVGAESLAIADDLELSERIGQPRYAINPIGLKGVTVLLDKRLFDYSTILVGAGVPRMELELAPADLKRLSEADILDFSS